ncbi:methyl-CpG-binding domain-containing protein 7 isoform X1 [Amaranthus tricolor]|uniref:methyl-CpG-binding domain-containing protein 7 isoform X1 n=1 Tax=Amaranthus tricolor TaxID=29722 RepID=UPI002589EACC|nr:methyl-CpG-binding domain-containing protein 7 isoform X1 [Amaranthus tricolor]
MRSIVKTCESESPAKMWAQSKPIKAVHDPKDDMQIVPKIPEFELPDGWVVEVRPRGPNSSVTMSDKYYYEPGTGRQFRSLISVKRHLSGEEDLVVSKKNPCSSLVPYNDSNTFRRIAYGGKFLMPDELEDARQAKGDDIFPETFQPSSSSILPDGWIVEDIPRKTSFRSDRYFIEPETGKKFRSVPEVQRYLALQKYRSRCRSLPFRNHSTGPRSPAPRKKNKNTSFKIFKTSIVDLTNPPEMVSWVFSGDGKDDWSPLVEECVLPDYVKEQWAETFLLGMNNWKRLAPQLTMGEGNQATNR